MTIRGAGLLRNYTRSRERLYGVMPTDVVFAKRDDELVGGAEIFRFRSRVH